VAVVVVVVMLLHIKIYFLETIREYLNGKSLNDVGKENSVENIWTDMQKWLLKNKNESRNL
jgi:hypothetical protein